MKVRTSVTIRLGAPGETKHLPPGEYDKKELVGVDLDELIARGHAERLGAAPEAPKSASGGTSGEGASGQASAGGQS